MSNKHLATPFIPKCDTGYKENLTIDLLDKGIKNIVIDVPAKPKLEHEIEMWDTINKFENEVLNFFSGKTTAERKAKKVKDGIALVDDTLNIDSVKVVGTFIKTGVSGVISKGLNVFKKNKK